MTKWDDLSQEYVAFQNAQSQYEQTASALMMQFTNGLKAFMGIADHPASSELVKLVAVDPSVEGVEKFSNPVNFTQALSYSRADGAWRFGIKVTLGSGYNHLFTYFDIRLVLREQDGEFQNAKDQSKSFSFTLGQPGELEAAFEYFTGLIHDTLQTKPWDRVDRIPIGFDLSHKR